LTTLFEAIVILKKQFIILNGIQELHEFFMLIPGGAGGIGALVRNLQPGD
jgi:hypothetical protein